MVGIIYTGTKPKKKINKKPGWKEEERQHQEWLASHKSNPKLAAELKSLKKKPLSINLNKGLRTIRAPSKSSDKLPESTFKKLDPRVLYKDNPEMLERELKARERVFPVAPAYNKGGDVLMSEDMINDMKKGLLRRRI